LRGNGTPQVARQQDGAEDCRARGEVEQTVLASNTKPRPTITDSGYPHCMVALTTAGGLNSFTAPSHQKRRRRKSAHDPAAPETLARNHGFS
jgi:hypothetical protein